MWSCLSARPRSRAIIFGLRRSAAAPVNFCSRITSSTRVTTPEKPSLVRYPSQVDLPISRNKHRPDMVIARIFSTGSCVATPWNVTSLSSYRGFSSTHSKYSHAADHTSSGSRKTGFLPWLLRISQKRLPIGAAIIRHFRSLPHKSYHHLFESMIWAICSSLQFSGKRMAKMEI